MTEPRPIASRTVRFDERVDVARSFSPFRRGGGDPTYQVQGQTHWRTTRLTSGAVTFRYRQTAPDQVKLGAWGPGADELQSVFANWLPHDDFNDLDIPDAVIADARRRFPGLRTPRTHRVLEALIPAIIEQKVVGRDAFASWRRLVMKFGEPAPGPTPLPLYVLPAADQWAAIPAWDWHRAGVDPRRSRIAQSASRLGDRLDQLAQTGDDTGVYRALRAIPGVGAWTAAEVGARALGDADAVSWGDYHLANTVGMGLLGERITDELVPELLEPYRPYRGRVVQLLGLTPLASHERRGPRMSRVDYRDI